MKRILILCAFSLSIAASAAAQSPYEIIHGDILRRLEDARAHPLYGLGALMAPEPTPVQLQFDVLHYDLNIACNPVLRVVDGTVRAVIESLTENLQTIDFDAYPCLSISSVSEVGAGPLPWSHAAGIVTVNRSPGLAQGEQIEIEIAFGGEPMSAAHPGLFFNSQGGYPVIYSLSQPWSARTWWPCKDYPDDKATFDLCFSVPADLFAASNGEYLGFSDTTLWGAPYRSYRWREDYVMSAYLASIAATNYVRLDDHFVYAPGETMAVTHYVYPSKVPAAEIDFNITVPALEFFSSIYGLYPFVEEKYGAALCSIGGGMEHQTLTSYGAALVRGDHYYDWVFVHEMSHMWFGDLITCRDWTQIWLNEGFASYSEALWFEHVQGPSKLRSYMAAKDRPSYWNGPILRDPDNDDPWYYFNDVVYSKAAWVLHMFRHVAGDSLFFQIIRDYADDTRFRFGVVSTDDFVGVCEDHYGSSLDWFFDPWLTRNDRLSYRWSWRQYPWEAGTSLVISVDQLQTDLYTMPVDFRITTSGGSVDTLFWVGCRHEEFHLASADAVVDVEFDPDHWILCDKTEAVTGSEPMPATAFLDQNYPNPFNPSTAIRYGVSEPGSVALRVFDVRGALVRSLVDGHRDAGVFRFEWDGRNAAGEAVSSGVYFYRLQTGRLIITRKMVLLR